jgi:DNA-binding PadR family transcriptional regulator
MRKPHFHFFRHPSSPAGGRRGHFFGPDGASEGPAHHGRHGRHGGGDMPRQRRFSGDDLQLMLLALIAERPSHGYELIRTLDTRSNGFYVPSQGMVYPALAYLEDVGHVNVELEGNRKRYAIADAGQAYLAENRERVDLMFAKLVHIARKMDSVRRAYAGEESAEEGPAGPGRWLPEFVASRRALKHALLLRSEASEAEQRRIAAILARATAEIEQPSGNDAA